MQEVSVQDIQMKIGVGVAIFNGSKVLLGKRLGSHGKNTWGFPGGHLELGESVQCCAHREVLEETGISIENYFVAPIVTNDIFQKQNKYVTFFAMAKWNQQKPLLLEPEKCLEWRWFEWDNLPGDLFLPIKNLLKQNFNPFEYSVIKKLK